MEQKILDIAYQLFTTQGIHQFTMDDLAARLGISKKTLYRYFVSRQELVEQVCGRMTDEYEASMEVVDQEELDSLQRLLGYIHPVMGFCKKVTPVFFNDLRRHFPLQWTELQLKLENTVKSRLVKVLENGIQEGYFRGNLHPTLVMAIWQQHLQRDFEFAAMLVNDYSKEEVFRQAIYLFLYGVVAPGAISKLEEELSAYKSHMPAIAAK
ncbi:MAG: TetR/AcrR family transcriptional regulator [Candidatus Pseudobacter hemicellulosilyticus]|uniref:TetR/AcrR family transcriptional regulator n=1 Tax=Candidatus Pseudobacter hemicellulosilyticus TaxID=3121375 RepID=A0AAJ6BHA1_9BACT|nr:MAG: TetR/AcrR family transcriptional regulator [Pseudobacter sp.]